MKTDNKSRERISKKDIAKLLFPIFHKFRFRLLAGFAALICVDILQLTIPRFIKSAIDGLSASAVSEQDLGRIAFYVIAVASMVIVLRFTWRYLIIGFSRLLEQVIRNTMFRHILKMDTPFFEKYSTGDLMARVSNDLSAIQMACGMGMVAAVDASIMSAAAIGFMIAISPGLSFFALLPLPMLAIATRILTAKLHKHFGTVQEQFAALTEFSRSSLLSIRLIKSSTMEDFQTNHFDRLGRKYVDSNLATARINGLLSPLSSLAGSTGMLMVLFFGGKLVIEQTISLGDFAAFITYLYMLIWPMMAIGWVVSLVQRGLTSLGRVNTVLKSRSSMPAIVPQGDIVLQENSTISIKSLDFSYPESLYPALNGLSLELLPGIHGLTGRTGSGKTTLCKILTRQYPVPDNTIFFNGTDINTIPFEHIHLHIAYVSQEPLLFSDTIYNNICLAVPDASREDVFKAAQLAAIHKDILHFTDGYETIIGERGVRLSGGQKQRLALARAFLTDRPLLIIDDGLSAIDVETEDELFTNLRKHVRNKSVLIVSNRVKLLSMTDTIFIMEDGQIQACGSHEQLRTSNTLYKAMFAKQIKAGQSTPEGTLP